MVIDVSTRIELDENTVEMLRRNGSGNTLRLTNGRTIDGNKRKAYDQNAVSIPTNEKETGGSFDIGDALDIIVGNNPIVTRVVLAFILSIIVFLALNISI